MKTSLFILLIFISFQGFSQTVKLPKIGLEIMTTDLGYMTRNEAISAVQKLGGGWRLPTIQDIEKAYKLEKLKKLGNEWLVFVNCFKKKAEYDNKLDLYSYWCSSINSNHIWFYYLYDDPYSDDGFHWGHLYFEEQKFFVRVVRPLK